MRLAGVEILARWREAGEWWAGSPGREYARYIDAKGVRRESWRMLDWLEVSASSLPTEQEDHREDYDVRARKRRDEKVAQACGLIEDPKFAVCLAQGETGALLHGLSGYSFGRSVILAEEMPAHAAVHGWSACLLADRFSLAGAREFVKTARKVGVKPLLGATLELEDGGEIVLIAKDRRGWSSLSRLITACHLEEPRGFPLANWQRLEANSTGLIALTGGDPGILNRALAKGDMDTARAQLRRMISLYGRENVFIQIERAWLPWEQQVNRRLIHLSETEKVLCVTGGPLTHIERGAFPAQDVLVCVESLCRIDEVDGRKPQRGEGQAAIHKPPRRAMNAERHFRTVQEARAMCRERPEFLDNTIALARRCDDNILPGRMALPLVSDNEPGLLREMVFDGMRRHNLKPNRRRFARIEYELERISRLGFAGHFIIAADMCDWARSQGILFSGRGSVVDSAVAYCLGISRIDAYAHDLHFDRFLPDAAGKRPDIDIDFEAARRNDVRDYLQRKFGAAHVATVAAFGAYRSRGIVRDVGKVLGIPPETLNHLAKRLHGSVTPERLREAMQERPELRDGDIPVQRLEWVFRLGDHLTDVPTNIRAHSSGVIVSRDPIADIVPVMLSGVEDVPIIQWDKRSARDCFDKFDVLCLRGNDVLSGVQQRKRAGSDSEFAVEQIPLNDDETYRAMRAGQLIGIPQSASPAMRQAHMRLQTKNLTDASLVQAGIRPGVGGAVKINELIARRRGKPFGYSSPQLEKILGNTYGIIVFQEQVDQLLQTFAGYSSDEAEITREAIHKRRRERYASAIQNEVIARITSRGYSHQMAEEVFQMVSGFDGYGFAQGHALAFAEISVRSIACQQNFPAPYFASLLDAQPAGYYGPATIANEARIRGVKMLHPHVNRSGLKYQVEPIMQDDLTVPEGGLRIPLSQIGGLTANLIERILFEREKEEFASYFSFVARTRPNRDDLERLILCGALDEFSANRRALLWAIPDALSHAEAMSAGGLPLVWHEPPMPQNVADFPVHERAIRERYGLGLDVDHHLVALERQRIRAHGGITAHEASRLPPGEKAFVVGNPIRLRFPPTKSGRRIMFFDLEDETGLLNVTCFDETYQRYGEAIVCSSYITLHGTAQDRDGHTAFLAERATPYRPRFGKSQTPDSSPLPQVTQDFLVG